MGVAPLRLETGRYEQIEDRRVCFNCPNGVESEEYVIVECPVFFKLKNRFVLKNNATYPRLHDPKKVN